jgi:hypothetical protein
VAAFLFDGIDLIPRLPRYPTSADKFRLDSPPAARFRDIVDRWVAGDSEAVRKKTLTDLLEPKNSLGTFHELLLREVLRRKFGEPEREPQGLPLGKKNPDFGIKLGRSGRLVIFESATVGEKVDDRTRSRRAIMTQLDRVSGPWHLIPEWTWSIDLENVPPSVVEKTIRRVVAGLAFGQKHHIEERLGNALLKATVLPASRHRESIVSMDFSGGMSFSPGVESIRDDIKKKTAKYRGLKPAKIPFILAIGGGSSLIDWESVFVALYGDEQVTITVHGDEVVKIAEGNLNLSGRITPKPGMPPVDTTLSAAWMVRWRWQENEMYAEVVHLPNPWAANPVRILGRDVARTTWRRLPDGRVTFLKPRHLPMIKVS